METIQNLDFVIVPRLLIFDEKLRRVDCLVYGVVYALSQLTGSCTASNETLGKTVGITKGAAATSLKRLVDCGYVQSLNDPKTNWRRGIVPLVAYEKKPQTPYSNEVAPKPIEHPPKRSSRGVIRQEDKDKKISTNTTNVVEPKAHGNEEINKIVTAFNETFNVDHKQDRRYAQHFRRKFGVEVTLLMFTKTAEAQSQDKFCPRTPTIKDFWYQIPKLQDYFRRREQTSGITEITL